MLHNLFNRIFRRTLNRRLERFNMTSLYGVQDVTNLSINFRLLSRVLYNAVRLNNLSLGIQVVLIPLNGGIFSRDRAFKVQGAIRMNRISSLPKVPTNTNHVKATSYGARTRDHREDYTGRRALDIKSRVSLLHRVVPTPPYAK